MNSPKNTIYKIYPWIVYVLLASILFFYGKAVFYSQVNVDAGWYIPAAKRIAEGYKINIDYKEMYMPLSMHIYALVYRFVEQPDYSYFVFINVIFILASAFLLYKIIQHWFQSHLLSISSSVMLLYYVYANEGIIIELEPFVIFFYLCAFYVLVRFSQHKWAYILTGLFIFLSFFAKQYGIAVLAPCGIFILLTSNGSLKKIVINSMLVAIGILCGTALYLSVNYLIFEIDPQSSLSLFYSKSYGNKQPGKFLLYITPFLFAETSLWLASVFLSDNQTVKKYSTYILVSATGLIVFLFPMYFAQYTHYKILAIPFIVLLSACFFHTVDWKNLSVFKIITVALLVIFSFRIPFMIGINSLNPSTRAKQVENAHKLNKHIPPQSPVACLEGTVRYRALSDLFPTDLKKFGYNFVGPNGGIESEEDLDYMYSKAQYITSEKELSAIILDKYDFLLLEKIANDLYLYKKK